MKRTSVLRSSAAVLSLLLFCAPQNLCAKLLTETDVDQDQEQELVLENSFCRLVIKPSLGKAIALAIKPSNTELLRGAAGKSSALFGAYIEQQGKEGDFLDKPYTVEVVANNDEKAVVRLTRVGGTDLLRWITIAKTITLRADRAAVDVEYEISNEQASMEDYHLGLGIFNLFQAEGEASLTLPLSGGVLRKVLSAQVLGQSDQTYEPARGWGSVILEGGNGVAFLMEDHPLKEFYEWHKATTRTFEWTYVSAKIEQGKSFKTGFQVIPFQGLSQVDGVVKGRVGNIELAGVAEAGKRTPVRVKLSGGSGDLPTVRISVKRLPDGPETVLGEGPVTRAKDGTLSAQAEFTPEQDGAYVIRARVMQGKEPLGEFERPIQVGQASQAYTLTPLAPRMEEDKVAAARKIPMPAGTAAAKKAAAPIQDLPPDITLSDAIKTPHIPWANPYYLGKTKVFFLMPSTKEREVIELAQRFSMEYFTVTHGTVAFKAPWALMKTWNASVAAAHQKKILEDQALDVIVSCAPWDNLDPEVQRLVLQRVRNGTGLVTISPRLQNSGMYGYKYACALSDEELKAFPESLATSAVEHLKPWRAVKPHFVTTGVPLEIMRSKYSVHAVQQGEVLAEVGSHPLIVAGEYGKGRVVALNYNPDNYFSRDLGLIPNLRRFSTDGLFEPNPDFPTYDWWEYCWSLVIKSALWASGREPELLIEAIQPDAGGEGVTLQLDNRRKGGDFTFELTVRNGYAVSEYKRTIAQRVAEGRSSITLPVDTAGLSGGWQLADVIIRSGDLVINWGSVVLKRAPAASLSALALEKTSLDPGDAIVAAVTLSGPLAEGGGLTLWAMLYDARGRLLEELPLAAAAGVSSVKATVPTAKIETIPFFLHVQLRKGAQVVDEKRVRGIMPQSRPWDDYIYCLEMSIGFHGYYVPPWIEQFRKAGGNMLQSRLHANSNFGECLDSDLPLADGSRFIDDFGYNMGGKEEVYRELKANYTRTKDLAFLVREPCFNNPAYRAKTLATIAKIVGFMKRFGKMDYLLTDELSMTNYGDPYDFCFCEHCRKAFREWVRPQYRGLDELNAAYGMKFASWDEVRMVSTVEARESGKWAGWADHRSFNESSMHAFFRWMRDEARKIQPEATINLSGTQAPTAYNGHDIWLRSQSFDNLWCYGYGQQTRMHRSFNLLLKQMPWGGYGSSGVDMHHKIWSNVLQGGHGNAFYWFPIYMDPDFRLSPSSQAWSDAARDLLNGIGKTLLTSTFDDYGIGIHYSQPSIHAAYVLDAASTFDADRAAWTEGVIEGSQFNARFLAYAQLERGELVYPKVKVLILPYSIALSDKEAEAIRQFVASGGTLIADVQTGIMDNHCQVRAVGAIDDVLGIKRAGAEIRPVDGEGTWNTVPGCEVTPQDLGVQLQEPGIAVTTGQALYSVGSTPGIIMNSFGKGRSWYLNFSLAKFETLQNHGKHQAILALVRRMLDMAGVKPYAALVDKDGRPLPSCAVFAYHKEPLHFIGILPDLPSAGLTNSLKGRLIIPKGYQLIDMRKRAPADPDEVTLLPGMAQFYALLPYAVKGVRVTAPASVRQGEPVAIGIQLDVKKGKAGDHVIRVETRDPSGTPVYYYSANLVSAKGAASYTINLPLNAALGTWRVTATDLPSGKEQSVDVRVEAGDRAAPSVNPPAGAGPTDAAAGQASKGPARDAWGGAPRSPRETFTPQTNQVPFNLNGSILKNPALIEVGAPGEAPRHWEGIMLQESGHSAKEPYAKLVRIEQDPSTPFMDQPSIKVTLGATDEEKTLLEIRQIIPKSDVRGKKVRLTFYAYRENPPAGREFWIRSVFVDANGVAKGSGFTVTPRIPAGTWVRCFAEGAVDPESAALKVSLVGHFSGKPDTFWFSGFRLEAVE